MYRWHAGEKSWNVTKAFHSRRLLAIFELALTLDIQREKEIEFEDLRQYN